MFYFSCYIVCFKVYENGTLIIREVYREDDGKYGCIAGNSGGFEREEAYLRVASEFTTFIIFKKPKKLSEWRFIVCPLLHVHVHH